jgi:hypothetical protein
MDWIDAVRLQRRLDSFATVGSVRTAVIDGPCRTLSLTQFYHSGRLPRSRLRLLRCATSPAMSLLSLTVVSHSRRAILGCAAVGAEFAVPGVASGSGVLGV